MGARALDGHDRLLRIAVGFTHGHEIGSDMYRENDVTSMACGAEAVCGPTGVVDA
jgi:hypothetical protein